MKREHLVAQSLADAMLAGSCEVEGFIERAAWLLGRKHRWLAPLCNRVFRTFGSSLEQRDRARLTEWIRHDRGYRRRVANILAVITKIAVEEGFDINHRKTRAMHRSHRQILTGVVVNEKPNVRRKDFDRLKAVLTNCAREGPASQNRDTRRDFQAHLSGRIANVAPLNWERGTKLQEIFRRIEWQRLSRRDRLLPPH